MEYYFGSHLTTCLCISIVTWLATLAIEGQSLGNGIIGGIILTSSIAIDLLKNIKVEKTVTTCISILTKKLISRASKMVMIFIKFVKPGK